MKKILTLASLALSVPAMAQAPYELQIPSLQDQVAEAEKIKADEVVRLAQTDPGFAGTLFIVKLGNQEYAKVDRRNEPRAPATPPPVDKFVQLAQGFSTGATGNVHFELKIKKNADGSEEQTWVFDMKAGWQAEESMSEAMGKQHR